MDLVKDFFDEFFANIEYFKQLVFPSTALGYSTLLLFDKDYLLGLQFLDKLAQSFLVGSGIAMASWWLVVRIEEDKKLNEVTERVSIICLLLASAIALIVLFRPSASLS